MSLPDTVKSVACPIMITNHGSDIMTVCYVNLKSTVITKLSSDDTAPDPREFKKVGIEDRETDVHFNFYPQYSEMSAGELFEQRPGNLGMAQDLSGYLPV